MMNLELTTSMLARQNILNNSYALTQLEEHLALSGLVLEGKIVFVKSIKNMTLCHASDTGVGLINDD